MKKYQQYVVKDADGVEWAYRNVCSHIERRRPPSGIWMEIAPGDMARMTPAELRCLADTIERQPKVSTVTLSASREAVLGSAERMIAKHAASLQKLGEA